VGTVIRLAPHGPSTLDAYDLRGRRVARVYAGASSTPVTVRWDGRSTAGGRLPTGVYWLVLAGDPDGPVSLARAPRMASARVVLFP
jgi:hypothetical protein